MLYAISGKVSKKNLLKSYLSRFLSPAEPVLERVMFLERLKGLLDCVQSY